MATILVRVKGVILSQLDVDESEINLGSRFTEDLHADSLDKVELIGALEEEFIVNGNEIEISDEDAEKMITVEDVIECLQAKGVTDE